MNIAVMGAGAVGCYYGGMLGRAGNDVTLIGREAHVEAIRKGGLRLETRDFDTHVPVQASTRADAVRGARLVLFSVKSSDTESAGREIAPHLDAGALVLTLQNGVDNAERLQAVLRQRVAPAVVYVATGMAGPGHVKHHGRGELVVAPDIASEELVALFRAAGVTLQSSPNVAGALWMKLIVNCAYNALSAITQLPYGRLVQGEGIEAVMREATDECLAVARAAGVEMPGDAHEAVRQIARTMPTQHSSTAQDLARGKRTEIDHLNGFVVRKAEALGIPAPVNRTLHALVKLMEAR
jgi:2-dehydropantoate 2-reductase